MSASDRSPLVARRCLLIGGPIALAGMAGSPASSQSAALRETADLITGPFYPIRKPSEADADMTHVGSAGPRSARTAQGQIVRLRGRLRNVRGEALPGHRIEIWQANARGRYAHPSDPNTQAPLDPDFQGYARLQTDREGRFALTTVKPGAYPTPRGDLRAPHIHFEVHGTADRKTTQMFFPNEPLNAQDRHLNSVRRPETLLARLLSPATDSVWTAEWDIILTTG